MCTPSGPVVWREAQPCYEETLNTLRTYLLSPAARTLVACVIIAMSGCVEHPTSVPLAGKSPKTFFWLSAPGSIAEGISTQQLHWWGEDPDGYVVGYLFAIAPNLRTVPVADTITYTFVTRTDSTIRFPLLTSRDTFLVVVRAVDNRFTDLAAGMKVKLWPVAAIDRNADGMFAANEAASTLLAATDPIGARQAFPLRNSPPSVKFATDPLNPANTLQPPDTTFTVASFSWVGADPDGDETLANYRIALNSTAASAWLDLPASVTLVTILAPRTRTDGVSGSVTADVYSGTFPNMRLLGQVPGLKLDAINTLYLQARDVASDTSASVRLPSGTRTWYVRKPSSRLLVIGDYAKPDSVAVLGSYRSWFATVAGGRLANFDFLNIRSGGQPGRLVPSILNPAFVKTLQLFDAVVWYTDQFPSLTVAQFPLFLYASAGGKVLFTTEFSSAATDARSSLVDFTPLDSLFTGTLPAASYPYPGDSRLPQGYVLSPVNGNGYPRLTTNTLPTPTQVHLVFMRPLYRRADATTLYTLQPDTGNGTASVPARNRYLGTPQIAVIDGGRRFVFVGMPLHLLDGSMNGGQGVISFLNRVFVNEFGL